MFGHRQAGWWPRTSRHSSRAARHSRAGGERAQLGIPDFVLALIVQDSRSQKKPANRSSPKTRPWYTMAFFRGDCLPRHVPAPRQHFPWECWPGRPSAVMYSCRDGSFMLVAGFRHQRHFPRTERRVAGAPSSWEYRCIQDAKRRFLRTEIRSVGEKKNKAIFGRFSRQNPPWALWLDGTPRVRQKTVVAFRAPVTFPCR